MKPNDADAVAALGAISPTQWLDRAEAEQCAPHTTVEELLRAGLLVGDDEAGSGIRQRDETVRTAGWHPPHLLAHQLSRWNGVRAAQRDSVPGPGNARETLQRFGPPPSTFPTFGDAAQSIDLPPPALTPVDDLLHRRVTCRNFAVDALPLATLATLLHRTFAAQATHALAPELVLAKKTSPSAGSLHPVEAFLLVQRVNGLAVGTYHYRAGEHRLRPLTELDAAHAARLADAFVAGQHWFADAPVLVVLVARFERTFWKYREHPKAYRAVMLDAGHLSQMLYLSATELGLGAFVTAAMNEVEVEQALGLDALRVGPIAVCGFGPRAPVRTTVELDPEGRVWADASGHATTARDEAPPTRA